MDKEDLDYELVAPGGETLAPTSTHPPTTKKDEFFDESNWNYGDDDNKDPGDAYTEDLTEFDTNAGGIGGQGDDRGDDGDFGDFGDWELDGDSN